MKRFLILALSLVSLPLMAQSDDFGLDFSVEAEKKICRGIDFTLEGNARTQDDTGAMERWGIGGAFGFKVLNTKTFDLKVNAGWEYIWQQKLEECEVKFKDDGITPKGYNVTESYWRPRHRTTLGLSGAYTPNKRWSFSLKEMVQYNHYNAVDDIEKTKYRYNGENELVPSGDPEMKTKEARDRFVLRSRFTAKYDIRHSHFAPYASVDYGCGLNYTTSKWKLTAGTDYKLSKTNKLTAFYRFQHEDDEDEPNGHIIGVGYSVKF